MSDLNILQTLGDENIHTKQIKEYFKNDIYSKFNKK